MSGSLPLDAIPIDETADRRLVTSFLKQRDEESFIALYRKHSPYVFPLIRRLLGPGFSEAEDVLQETWLRAVDNLPRFRWASSLRTWVAGIAVNLCRERRRAGARGANREAPLDESREERGPSPSPWSAVDLERAVAALPDGYREVIVLHDVEGFTHEEIAGLLGIEAGTSKSQLSRARSAMRLLLENERTDVAPGGIRDAR